MTRPLAAIEAELCEVERAWRALEGMGNPYHDAEGKFTSGPGAGGGGKARERRRRGRLRKKQALKKKWKAELKAAKKDWRGYRSNIKSEYRRGKKALARRHGREKASFREDVAKERAELKGRHAGERKALVEEHKQTLLDEMKGNVHEDIKAGYRGPEIAETKQRLREEHKAALKANMVELKAGHRKERESLAKGHRGRWEDLKDTHREERADLREDYREKREGIGQDIEDEKAAFRREMHDDIRKHFPKWKSKAERSWVVRVGNPYHDAEGKFASGPGGAGSGGGKAHRRGRRKWRLVHRHKAERRALVARQRERHAKHREYYARRKAGLERQHGHELAKMDAEHAREVAVMEKRREKERAREAVQKGKGKVTDEQISRWEAEHAKSVAAVKEINADIRKQRQEWHAGERAGLRDERREAARAIRERDARERRITLKRQREEREAHGFRPGSARSIDDGWSVERKQQGNPYHDAEGHFTNPGGVGHAGPKGRKARKKRKRREKRPLRKPGASAQKSPKKSEKVGHEGAAGGGGGRGARVAEKAPSAKAERAKAAYKASNADEQRYAEVQEVRLAESIGGKSLPDNEAIDVHVKGKSGEHGLELKTMVSGKNDKITMKASAVARKVAWEKEAAGRTMHTVVLDHRDKFGSGENAALHSGHEIYYKRGVGAFRIGTMHKVKDHEELLRILDMPESELPVAARGPKR